MTQAVNILHHLPLSSRNWGGIQVQFAHFLRATRDDERLRNFLSVDGRALPRQFDALRPTFAGEAFDYRTWRGLSLPRAIRLPREAAQARRWAIDVVLNTNLLGDMRAERVARSARATAVYWERGAAWFPRDKPLPTGFASGHRLFMSNSVASRQMLREVWNIDQPVEVCSPCVWAPADGADAPRLRLAPERPLRLGLAARLRAFKGGVLAVHTIAELGRRGIDAVLLIAGEGPDRAAIETQAARLGISDRIRCLGQVDDMDAFYRGIDVLLHPALREPYGNVCAEAALWGVPTVATRVDGLPEVVADGVSGLCVTPDLPLSDFASFGGDAADVYPVVFKPERGKVGEPGLPSPIALAEAVEAIAGSSERYAVYSRGAVETVREQSSVSRYLDRFTELMRQAATA